MKRAAMFLMLAFLLWSCAPDPRREADAYATRQQSDAQAAAQAQALKQDAERHDAMMQRVHEVSQWISTVMTTSMVAIMFTLFVAIVSFGIGSSFVFIGGGISTAKRQLAKPYHDQIKLDPITRQYPLLITKVADGKYSLTNPNVGSVTMLYDRNPADRLMIQAMSATQHAGALAYQARLSHRPGEVVQINAPELLLEAE